MPGERSDIVAQLTLVQYRFCRSHYTIDSILEALTTLLGRRGVSGAPFYYRTLGPGLASTLGYEMDAPAHPRL